jgi:hypothetical protein
LLEIKQVSQICAHIEIDGVFLYDNYIPRGYHVPQRVRMLATPVHFNELNITGLKKHGPKFLKGIFKFSKLNIKGLFFT